MAKKSLLPHLLDVSLSTLGGLFVNGQVFPKSLCLSLARASLRQRSGDLFHRIVRGHLCQMRGLVGK